MTRVPLAAEAPQAFSSARVRWQVSVFIGVLLVSQLALALIVVRDVFGRIEASTLADLNREAIQRATTVAAAAGPGFASGDQAAVDGLFARAKGADIGGWMALSTKGPMRIVRGTFVENDPFLGPALEPRVTKDGVVIWAESRVENEVVGKIGLRFTLGRMASSGLLENRIVGMLLAGFILAVGLGLLLVNVYLVPLLRISQQGLRTAREMEIARRIQSAILPQDATVDTLAISATVLPASDMGGDIYDVLPAETGCWIAIGDVAGHGLQAGLVMLMLQSILSTAIQCRQGKSPSAILSVLNKVLFDNVRNRLKSDEHVTFTLFRFFPDGHVIYAGAHEEILVYRVATGRCEHVATDGPWMCAVKNVDRSLKDAELKMQHGDMMVLHTDGVTEAAGPGGELFGIERLEATIVEAAGLPVPKVRDRIMAAVHAWMTVQDDDVTIMVICYTEPGSVA